jgi:hypothetical protein
MKIGPLRYLRRKVAYHPVSVRSLYTEAPRMPKKIPNRVYQTWKEQELPLALALEIRRFRKLNPDYSFSFFDDQQMAEYMESRYAGHPILPVFREARVPVLKADIWRYCILFREGGIYCDIKSAVKIPLRELLRDDVSELVSFEGLHWKDLMFPGRYADAAIYYPGPPEQIRSNLEYPENTILNWCLCFEKAHPILETIIDLIVRQAPFYRNKTFENMSMAGNHFTGVIAFTQAVWMWMQKTGRRPEQSGIDYSGHGVWKLRGMNYRGSPHHSSMKNMTLL